MPDNKVNDHFTESEVKSIKSIVDDYFSTFRKIIKAFLWGLGIFIVIAILSGLISKRGIIVFLHDQIFGIEELIVEKVREGIKKEAAVSYHQSFILDDQNQPKKTMLFYAKPGQEIEMFILVEHTGIESRHKINVSVDKSILYREVEKITGGFKPITEYVFPEDKRPPLLIEKNVHSLEFSLSDTEFSELGDKVIVECVIVVFGRMFDENK